MGKLSLNNICISRSEFSVNIPSLNVDGGTVLGIIGPSGSGKSTLLNAIAGFEEIESGEISLDGRVISELAPEKRRVAVVFQRPALFPHLTVLNNVCFGLRVQGISREKQLEIANHWLGRMNLQSLADRYPDKISGGEAQRVALIRSLVVGFPVLLLDEPFSALDIESKKVARKVIAEVVSERKLVTVLVSHDPDDIENLATEFCKMQLGKIVEQGQIRKQSS
jgi:ABC-type Fe3+/spermidine/putrescine transport system ATPase subunit